MTINPDRSSDFHHGTNIGRLGIQTATTNTVLISSFARGVSATISVSETDLPAAILAIERCFDTIKARKTPPDE